MPLTPLAGKPAPAELLIDVDALLRAYQERLPEPNDPQQRMSFGTRSQVRFFPARTHALSAPAERTAIEVLAANGVTSLVQAGNRGFTPTPAVSHAILARNRGRESGLADGIVVSIATQR